MLVNECPFINIVSSPFQTNTPSQRHKIGRLKNYQRGKNLKKGEVNTAKYYKITYILVLYTTFFYLITHLNFGKSTPFYYIPESTKRSCDGQTGFIWTKPRLFWIFYQEILSIPLGWWSKIVNKEIDDEIYVSWNKSLLSSVNCYSNVLFANGTYNKMAANPKQRDFVNSPPFKATGRIRGQKTCCSSLKDSPVVVTKLFKECRNFSLFQSYQCFNELAL